MLLSVFIYLKQSQFVSNIQLSTAVTSCYQSSVIYSSLNLLPLTNAMRGVTGG